MPTPFSPRLLPACLLALVPLVPACDGESSADETPAADAAVGGSPATGGTPGAGGEAAGGQAAGGEATGGTPVVPDAGPAPEVDAAVEVADLGLPPAGGPDRIRFRAQVGDAAFGCGQSYGGLGPAADKTVELVDFRFYVHGIELLTADGTAVPFTIADEGLFQGQGVALLDFETGGAACAEGTDKTHDEVTGSAPPGDYVGVRFVVGVPFELNHAAVDTAPAPLNFSAMFWNWQGGYKFVRVDAVGPEPEGGGARPFFPVHLGSTGCDGTPAGGVTTCANPNRPTVEFAAFNPATDVVVADFAELVEGLDPTTNAAASPPGCMSPPTDGDCVEVLSSFGLPVPGGVPAMDFFRVEAAE
jgi:uncharacterized repeat protein (TIGR04052 family)